MTAIEVLHSVVCILVVARPRAGRPKTAKGNNFVFSEASKLAVPHTEPLLVRVSGAVAWAAKWRGREATIHLRQEPRLPKRAFMTCTGRLPSRLRPVRRR